MEPDLRTPAGVGWFPDPLRRFELRYFNGERWTADVAADGTRFIDPLGTLSTTPPPRPHPPNQRHPARTLAVLAFVLALAGIALAWAPFVFVLGAGGSIAAVVLGLAALRRVRSTGVTEGSGRSFAIAAVAIAPAGLALCMVGVILTGVTYREFDDYLNPGPHRIEDEVCTVENRTATFSGVIVNLDDETRSYELLLQFLDGTSVVATERVDVDDVPPDGRGRFETTARVALGAQIRCRVRNVTGPYPFGLER